MTDPTKNNPLAGLSREGRAALRRLAAVESQVACDLFAAGVMTAYCDPGQEHHLEEYIGPQREWLRGLAAALDSARATLEQAQRPRPYGESALVGAGLESDVETLAGARQALGAVAEEAAALAGLLAQVEAAPDAVQGAALGPAELDQLVIGVRGMRTTLQCWARDIVAAASGGTRATR